MTTMLVSDFKARCLAVLERVNREGVTVLVTRRGHPLARDLPVAEQPEKTRKLGTLAGEASVQGDLVYGDAAEDWESAR